jgi:uncharacterized protein (TIGR02284 family)
MEMMMDDNGKMGMNNLDVASDISANSSPTAVDIEKAGIIDQQIAAEPILSDRKEQGIAQTGEEDPLSGVEDPDIAAAVRELSDNQKRETTDVVNTANPSQERDRAGVTANHDNRFGPVGASLNDSVLAWSQKDAPSPSETATLRSLVAALIDSVEGYEYAAREADEFFRSIFLDWSKQRREMVNEFHARILALGGVTEGDADYIPGFASSVRQALVENGHVLNIAEAHEANLRSLFLTAIDEQTLGTEAFLTAQYVVIQRSEEELRRLRSELSSR